MKINKLIHTKIRGLCKYPFLKNIYCEKKAEKNGYCIDCYNHIQSIKSLIPDNLKLCRRLEGDLGGI